LFGKNSGRGIADRNLRETDAAWLDQSIDLCQRERETNLKAEDSGKNGWIAWKRAITSTRPRSLPAHLAEFRDWHLPASVLFRTKKDLDALLPPKTVGATWKGAYKEPPAVAFPSKRRRRTVTSRSAKRCCALNATVPCCARRLATHDALMIKRLSDFCAQSQVVVLLTRRWRCAATSGGAGIVVVAGTGSIALGATAAGRQARCGAGLLIGDEGALTPSFGPRCRQHHLAWTDAQPSALAARSPVRWEWRPLTRRCAALWATGDHTRALADSRRW